MTHLWFFLTLGLTTVYGVVSPPNVVVFDNDYDTVAYFQDNYVIVLNERRFICLDETRAFWASKAQRRECLKDIQKETNFFTQEGTTPKEVYSLSPYSVKDTTVSLDDFNKRKLAKKYLPEYLEKKGFKVLNVHYYKKEADHIDIQFHLGLQMNCTDIFNVRVHTDEKPYRLTKRLD